MISITDIRNLLIPLPKKGDKSSSPQAEAAKIEAALEEMDRDRDATQKQINELSAKRRALLLEDGSDEAILAIDRDLDRLRLQLERYDEAEPALLDRLRLLHGAGRANDVDDITAAYRTAIDDFTATFRRTVAAREAMIAIRDQAVSQGHERALSALELPTISLNITRESADLFEAGAKASLSSFAPLPPTKPRHVVRFLNGWNGYRAGEQAGFETPQAHALVSAGVAEFVDKRRAPPQPAVNTGDAR